MNAELALMAQPEALTAGLGERWLFVLYQLATWFTFSAMDDAAMMAFAFS